VLPTYDILVAEYSAHRIRFISAGGGTVSTWAGSTGGSYGSSGDGKAATSALFNGPYGLARDPISGDVYVSDQGNQRIRVVRANGTLQAAAGSGSNGFLDSLNPLTANFSSGLCGIKFDSIRNRLIIADGCVQSESAQPSHTGPAFVDCTLLTVTAPTGTTTAFASTHLAR
jgi:DNA-binding beta-propeller fold protein YncE